MHETKQRKQSDVARRGSLTRLAHSADAERAALMLLQDEVRARRDQERAMPAFGLDRAERPATKAAQSTLQSVSQTLREHPVGVGIGALAAGVAIARAIQLRT
jgi:hypothetical protein